MCLVTKNTSRNRRGLPLFDRQGYQEENDAIYGGNDDGYDDLVGRRRRRRRARHAVNEPLGPPLVVEPLLWNRLPFHAPAPPTQGTIGFFNRVWITLLQIFLILYITMAYRGTTTTTTSSSPPPPPPPPPPLPSYRGMTSEYIVVALILFVYAA